MEFNPEKLRARFWELTADYDKKQAKLDPLQKELEKHVATASAKENAIREKIKKAREGMYQSEMERAAIARALGGKTGSPEE